MESLVGAAQVALRPRMGWEAADLGFVMARAWWRPIWQAWAAVSVPLALLALALWWNQPAWAGLAVWWLKPLFDRVVLHVLGEAVFGAAPSAGQTVRAWRRYVRWDLIGALTWQRFSLARSFLLPVSQLERLSGKEAARRRAALGRRERGFAVGLLVVCLHFELILFFGFGQLLGMITPAAADLAPDLADWWRELGLTSQWSIFDVLSYLLAVTVVEPFYVAGGFALYLNRRTVLEAWDIEQGLRRLGERLAAGASRAMIVSGCLLLMTVAIHDGHAAEKSARDEIRIVLKAPEFPQRVEGQRWQYRDSAKDEHPQRSDNGRGSELLMFIADVLSRLGWVVLALVALAIVVAAMRYVSTRARLGQAPPLNPPPQTLFGLTLAPSSLPDDVAAAAIALAQAGQIREALSLLYRAALSVLVHKHRLALSVGSTESDCLRLASGTLQRPAVLYLATLIEAWQAVAYAQRAAAVSQVEALAAQWREAFP